MFRYILSILTLLIFNAYMVSAQVPETINFQGILKGIDGELLEDGDYKLTFNLYNAETGGSALWTEEQNVIVTDGIFSVLLGKLITFSSTNVIFDKPYWLGVSVQDDVELKPRFELSSSPYALNPSVSTGTGDGNMPVGTVIDWWRPNNNFPVPTGFKICDGSTVDDEESPFNGFNVPDLRNKFVRGAESLADIGATGGSESHKHTVESSSTSTSSAGNHEHIIDPPSANTNETGNHLHSVDPPGENTGEGGAHNHTVDPPLTETTEDAHQHQWATFTPSGTWNTWKQGGSLLTLGDWDNGIGNSGSGKYPLFRDRLPSGTEGYRTSIYRHKHSVNIASFSSSSGGGHSHFFNQSAFNSSTTGNHLHNLDISSFSSSSTGNHTHNVDISAFDFKTASHIPEYYGLLKLIKIK